MTGFIESTLYQSMASVADRAAKIQQMVFTVLGGLECCDRAVHWSCLLDTLVQNYATVQQEGILMYVYLFLVFVNIVT